MAKTVFEIMNARYSFLTTTINSLEKKKNSYPDGIINIKTTKSGSYYYWHIDNKRNYLGRKDTDLVKQLIQKDLVSKAIKTAQKEAAVLQKLISEYPREVIEDLYDHLPECRKKYASPLFLDNEEYAQYWLSIPFTPKPVGEDVPDFYTKKGEHVRSKSEVIIGDRLCFSFESSDHPLDISWLDDFIEKNFR